MDKEYPEIKKWISNKEESFGEYVVSMLDSDAKTLLMAVTMQTPVYVFSGVIRDYFFNKFNVRDLDMVIRNMEKIELPTSIIERCQIRKNSFGGYKLHTGNLYIDVWDLNKRWSIQKENKKGNALSLIHSAFFNFSAIIYDYRRRKFLYGEEFLEFMKTRTMEVVYKENPNIELCIVNSLYYNKNYGFDVGKSLARWISVHYSEEMDFKHTQLQHFGRVLFNDDEIKLFYIMCLFKIM